MLILAHTHLYNDIKQTNEPIECKAERKKEKHKQQMTLSPIPKSNLFISSFDCRARSCSRTLCYLHHELTASYDHSIRFNSITHLLHFNLHMILISSFFFITYVREFFFSSSSFSPSIWPAIIIRKRTHMDYSLRFRSDCQPLATSIALNVIWTIVCMSMPFKYNDLEFFFRGNY